MEDTRIFYTKPEGRRVVGRPKLRCLDDIEADIKTPDTKRCRQERMDGNSKGG
jgi:hypothetical protein